MLIQVSVFKKVAYFIFAAYCMVWFRTIEWDQILQFPQGHGQHVIRFADRRIHFDYLIRPAEEICAGAPSLVAIVLSAPEDQKIRDAIRQQWASANYSQKVQDGDVEVMFVLSQPLRGYEMDSVTKEAQIHGDLIVTNLAETYENLLYKVYALFHWQKHFCKAAKFLLKVDQDVVVHFDRLLSFLPTVVPQFPQMYCKTWVRSMPKRDASSKWFVAGSQWKRKYFPTYCDGPAYVLSTNAVPGMLEAISEFPPIFIEDVFYTGVVAERLRIRRNPLDRVFHHTRRSLERTQVACSGKGLPLLATVHPVKGADKIAAYSEKMKIIQCRSGPINEIAHKVAPKSPAIELPAEVENLPIFDPRLHQINAELIASQQNRSLSP